MNWFYIFISEVSEVTFDVMIMLKASQREIDVCSVQGRGQVCRVIMKIANYLQAKFAI